MQGELLYTGKTKQIFGIDDFDFIVVHYKDDALAYSREIGRASCRERV